jgi:hypothetical protein
MLNFRLILPGGARELNSIFRPQADVNARDSSRMTPLHVHVMTSDKIVQALIKAKAEVDATDLQGNTALHCLTECTSKHNYPIGLNWESISTIVSFLIEASGGTVLFLKNQKGNVPSQLGSKGQLRSFLQREESRLQYVACMVELQPCLKALAGGLVLWADVSQESLRNVPVSKLQRVKVKISEMDTMLKTLFRAVSTTPNQGKLDRVSIRQQLVIVEQQAGLLLTLHDQALDGLVSTGFPDESERIACRKRKREKVVKDLGDALRSLLVIVRDLIAAL